VKGPHLPGSGLWIHSRFKRSHRHSPLSGRARGRTSHCGTACRCSCTIASHSLL
jgi:hypothetical protein